MTRTSHLMGGAAAAALAIGLALGGPAVGPDGAEPGARRPPPEWRHCVSGPHAAADAGAWRVDAGHGRDDGRRHGPDDADDALADGRPACDAPLRAHRGATRLLPGRTPHHRSAAAAVERLRGGRPHGVRNSEAGSDAGGAAGRPHGRAVPAPEQMERRIALLTAQADAMRTLQAAARPLYGALSAEQKRTADALMEGHLRGMGGAMGMQGGM